jgi:hypothetical protein
MRPLEGARGEQRALAPRGEEEIHHVITLGAHRLLLPLALPAPYNRQERGLGHPTPPFLTPTPPLFGVRWSEEWEEGEGCVSAKTFASITGPEGWGKLISAAATLSQCWRKLLVFGEFASRLSGLKQTLLLERRAANPRRNEIPAKHLPFPSLCPPEWVRPL